MRVLVAEDESLIRLDLVESLKSLGFDVIADVNNGAEAIQAAANLNPDVILLDIKMPIMDGLTAAKILIEKGFCCILVTAFSSMEIVAQASNIGVDGYIVKPWRLNSLQPAIEIGYAQYLRRKSLSEEVLIKTQEVTDQKMIDRARAIIISKYQMSESQAFQTMQRAAMDGRKSLTEVARSIIDQLG